MKEFKEGSMKMTRYHRVRSLIRQGGGGEIDP